jgi:hypothetical protein
MNAGLNLTGPPQANLLVGWIWLCLTFISGLLLGLGFHRENWLGGYSSLRRRLYRLAHISFFGLGLVNLAFYLTIRDVNFTALGLRVASLSFLAGAVSMPLCCLLMAHFPNTRALFAIPVLSLLLAGSLTVATLLRSHAPRSDALTTPGSNAPTVLTLQRFDASTHSLP